MDMTIRNLVNRADGRESSMNKSFQGWTVQEVDEYALEIAEKGEYKWEAELKSVVLNYVKYKVRSNKPITSKRRVQTLINYSKIMNDYLQAQKSKFSELTLDQGREFTELIQFKPSPATGKPYGKETQITIYKVYKALIRFMNSSRNPEPLSYMAGGGLAYILDYETGAANFVVSTYTKSDIQALIKTNDWYSQFIYNHLYHSGCRINEFIDSDINDFVYDPETDVVLWQVKVSKTRNGIRTIPLSGKPKENLIHFFAVYHNINLREWVPSDKTKGTPLLIYKEGAATGKRIQYVTLMKRLKQDCRSGNVSLPHTFKRFRSSGATKDAMNPKISDTAFDVKYGHALGGNMRQRYINKNDSQILDTLVGYEKTKEPNSTFASTGFNPEQLQLIMNLVKTMQHN